MAKAKAVKTAADATLGPRPRHVRLVIKNFRCIGQTPVTIDLDDIVVLVGPNNAGKSSVLKAYEVIMSEGSKAGELLMDDFPSGKVDPDALPQIELHTVVFDNSPGPEWMEKTDSGEMLVRELWRWTMGGHSLFYIVLTGTPIGVAVALYFADLKNGFSESDCTGRGVVALFASIVCALAILRVTEYSRDFASRGWLLIPVVSPPLASYLSQLFWKRRRR